MNLPGGLHQICSSGQRFTAPICPPSQREIFRKISADAVIRHCTGSARHHRPLVCQAAYRRTPCADEVAVNRALNVHQDGPALCTVCYPHRVNFEPPRGRPKVHGCQRRQPCQASKECHAPQHQIDHFSHVSHTFSTDLRCPNPTTSAEIPASRTMSIFMALPSTCQPLYASKTCLTRACSSVVN